MLILVLFLLNNLVSFLPKCKEMAIADANVYHKVLDTAIMRFHREKMTTLNNIVRELWRQTYKGNDIDYIEIRTKDTEARGEALLYTKLDLKKLLDPCKCLLACSATTLVSHVVHQAFNRISFNPNSPYSIHIQQGVSKI